MDRENAEARVREMEDQLAELQDELRRDGGNKTVPRKHDLIEHLCSYIGRNDLTSILDLKNDFTLNCFLRLQFHHLASYFLFLVEKASAVAGNMNFSITSVCRGIKLKPVHFLCLQDLVSCQAQLMEASQTKQKLEETLRQRERELTALKGALKEEVATHDKEIEVLREQYSADMEKLRNSMEQVSQVCTDTHI